MSNKYYFENDISDEERIYLKSIVKCNTNKRVGFYFTKNIKNINDYVKSKYNRLRLANCEVKFYISTQYIDSVSGCISSVISFLLEQEIKEFYSIVVNKISKVNYKIVLYEQINNISGEGKNVAYPLCHDPRLVNFIEVVNNNVVSFNCQYVRCGKWEYKLDHRNNKFQVNKLKDDCEIKFESDEKYCDLIDQYSDFTTILHKTSDKQYEFSLPMKLIKNKTVTIVDKQNQYDIKFTNYDNLNQINKYLREEFGQGTLSYKVDLKDNKTFITYVLN